MRIEQNKVQKNRDEMTKKIPSQKIFICTDLFHQITIFTTLLLLSFCQCISYYSGDFKFYFCVFPCFCLSIFITLCFFSHTKFDFFYSFHLGFNCSLEFFSVLYSSPLLSFFSLSQLISIFILTLWTHFNFVESFESFISFQFLLFCSLLICSILYCSILFYTLLI